MSASGFCRLAKFENVGEPLAPESLRQSRHEAVDVVLVVVDVGQMRRRPRRARDVDAFGRESLDEAGRHALRESRGSGCAAPAGVRSGTSTPMPRRPSASRSVSMARRSRNGGRAPVRHHLHADRRHLHRDEMVALAHVEAPRIGDIAEIARNRPRSRRARRAGRSRLLERNAVLVALGDVEEGAAVGTEHPLVGREDQEIRIECAHVDRQHAGAVRGVDQEARALLPQRARDSARCRSARRPTSAPTRSRRAPTGAAPGRSMAARTADGPVAVVAAGAPSRR